VTKMRVLLLLLLTVSSGLVSWGVYAFTQGTENETFEKEYYANARLITEAFHDRVESQIGAIGTMAASITSYAHATNQTLPYVLIDDFAVRGAQTRVAANTIAVQWVPILFNDSMREDWEAYAMEHRSHVDEAFEVDAELRNGQDANFGLLDMDEDNGRRDLQESSSQNEDEQSSTTVVNNILQDGSGYHPHIWNVKTKLPEPKDAGPYVPIWQRSPINGQKQAILGMNIAKAPALGGGAVDEIIRTKRAVVNKAIVPIGDGNTIFSANLKIGQYRHNVDEYAQDPVSFIGYPVFDSFNLDERNIVGLVVTNLYWRLHLSRVLPPSATGIICVIENSFNQTLTYRVDGSDVSFLGAVDFHEIQFESMQVEEDLNEYLLNRVSPETQGYMTVPLSDGYGRYTLKVYPSQATKDQYMSNQPTIYAMLALAVFLFTSLIFVAYDHLVERRQKIVMNRAVNADAIVSDLFPARVRDRMYGNGSTETKSLNRRKSLGDEENQISANQRPIADKFEHTTVFFADIAGFTAWSGSRKDPSQVFQLLQNLYAAFDAVAEHRGVFKVETIGDCYLAVCGLPEPQEDHALRMVCFAQDCLREASRITLEQSEVLGRETADLSLRVGLHSGSVIAGVLQGRKSRFQLFGDTVNTASRMESTGTKGRIQVSETTARELIAFGKSEWLQEREEKIAPKGKGEMQTYWATPTGYD